MSHPMPPTPPRPTPPTGAVDLLKRHSGIVWDPGLFGAYLCLRYFFLIVGGFAVFLRGEDAGTGVGLVLTFCINSTTCYVP